MQPVPETISTIRQQRLGTQTCAGNSLPIPLVLNITGSKDTLDARKGSAGLGDHIALGIRLQLTLDEVGGWVVADSIEQAIGWQCLLLARHHVLNDNMAHQTVVITFDLNTNRVETDRDLAVVQ